MEKFAVPALTPRNILRSPETIARFYDEPVCKALAGAASYITDFLTGPDPMLGRSGAVCPFVGSALLDDMITLSVLAVRTADPTTLHEAALSIKQEFVSMQVNRSKAEGLRAVIILLPYVDTADAEQMIETVQKALKPEMIASGLMIGEFYPGCTAPGLNNPAFRPSNTAFPFLALRRMTAGDLPFLVQNAAYVERYLAQFGDDGRRRLNKLLRVSPALPSPTELQAGVVAQSAMPSGIVRSPNQAG